ncbi:MAG: hypothetical protein AAF731_19920, partial [Bacteroidota bacterium]
LIKTTAALTTYTSSFLIPFSKSECKDKTLKSSCNTSGEKNKFIFFRNTINTNTIPLPYALTGREDTKT